jgi:hypothetical protein
VTCPQENGSAAGKSDPLNKRLDFTLINLAQPDQLVLLPSIVKRPIKDVKALNNEHFPSIFPLQLLIVAGKLRISPPQQADWLTPHLSTRTWIIM